MAQWKNFGGRKENSLIGIIADEDTVTGMLLAGIGDQNRLKGENYLVVDNKTPQQRIVDMFKKLTTRGDVSIILISQQVANDVRFLLDEYDQLLPTILEIPSPAHPYQPEKDSMMQRIYKMLGQT